MSIYLVVCKQDLGKLMRSWNSSKFIVKPGETSAQGEIFSLQVALEPEDPTVVPVFGNVLLIRSIRKEVYFVMSDESREFVQNTLRRFLNSYYPDVSRVFFTSNELRMLLRKLQSATNGEVITDRVTAFSRALSAKKTQELIVPEKPSKRKEPKNAAVKYYYDKPFEDAFDEAIANDEWIDKIQFHLEVNRKITLEAFLSRGGLIKMKRSFFPIYQTLFPYLLDIIQGKFKLYSNRARIAERPKPSPLVLELEYDVFEDIKMNHKFIETLQQMPYVSLSVYHGNPYIHLSIVDYLDGSSFEIWVLSANEITLVPQLRASEASISRIVNHIFARFREGTVKEYEVGHYGYR